MGPAINEVDTALTRLGHYRVTRAQRAALDGEPDGISGALLLAFMLRETWGRNIEGGAKRVGLKWVALDSRNPDDAKRMDVGALQISRTYHLPALRKMLAVKAGTWGPVVPGHSPADAGYVPRFEEGLQFTLRELHENMAYAADHGVKDHDLVRVAVAAHNAGIGGAISGYKRSGDPDEYTAGGDYAAWVLAARTRVNEWLGQHAGWRVG